MQRNHLGKILAIGIIVLFIGAGISSAISLNNNNVIILGNIQSTSTEITLNWKHLFPIIIDYYFIEHEQIKMVVKIIIIDLIFTGETTLEEILGYVDDNGLNPEEVYILPKIETIKITDGELYCNPGNFLSNLFGFNARGSYVRYKTWDYRHYGWHLKINSKQVSEKGGHLIGYYGFIRNNEDTWSYPPAWLNTISFNGYSCIAFHGC